MTSLHGKVIAITGAASGIGKATAHLLAARGATISIADVRQGPLEEALASIKESNPSSKIYHKAVNVTKADEVKAWLDETVKELGGLHGAANLAGVVGKTGEKTIQDLTDEDWDFVLDVNLKGVFNCIRAELQRMESGASIVSASSVAGLKGYGKGAPYSTSKVCNVCQTSEDFLMLTVTLACCYWPDKVRCARGRPPEHQGQLHCAGPHRYAHDTGA